MLSSLSLNNVALFKKQYIEFQGGFNCLLGQSGAGKSIADDAFREKRVSDRGSRYGQVHHSAKIPGTVHKGMCLSCPDRNRGDKYRRGDAAQLFSAETGPPDSGFH